MTGQFDIVVPTVGRPSLVNLLAALADGTGPPPGRIVLVDDRASRNEPLPPDLPCPSPAPLLHVVASGGRGPAAARNAGWRATTAPWVAFLDDDVVPDPDWAARLAQDVAACGPRVAATQGRLAVPVPTARPPTDWERNVAALEDAPWTTADMAYRRSILEQLGGFDERFPRAYREDADLGLRTTAAGHRIVVGTRRVTHPVGSAPWYASIVKQAGNADDALMDRLHGTGWRSRAGTRRGRRRRHLFVTATGLGAIAAWLVRRRRLAAVGAGAWLAGTVELAWRRIAPGPRTGSEVAKMVATSVALPPAATVWWIRGRARARRLVRSDRQMEQIDAVLFDRDGTLVVDVPYNGDPDRVVPVSGAREALDRLRAAGLSVAVVTNQSGIARGRLRPEQVEAVNARVEELLGPFDAWRVCPHAEGDRCDCRKPRPGMVLKSAAELDVDPARCALVGDIGTDVGAALAAGAAPVLVPTDRTRPGEIEEAPTVLPDLASAVGAILSSRQAGR